MVFLLGLFLLGLFVFGLMQYQKYCQVNKLYNQAKELEAIDPENPDDLSKLKEALAVYKQCSKLTNKSKYIKAVNQCQQKIDNSLRCKSLLTIGRKKAREHYFKEALHNFSKAQQLFSTDEIENELNQCHQGIARQNEYEQVLEQANNIAQKGDFPTAIDLLTPAVKKFTRQDGEQLLNKLRLVIKAKNLYQSGLVTEGEGQINNAIAIYEQTLTLIPEYTDCKFRLATIIVRSNPQQAIDYLRGIDDKQAAYIRGFARVQLQDWQLAIQEWSKIEHPKMVVQQKIIQDLLKRDRLNTICEIEHLVDNQQLELARSISLDFIQEHDYNSLVKNNLDHNIQPILESQIWQNEDWQEIVNRTEQIWLEQQDLKSLHNWAISTYYLAQVNSDKLTDFVIAWSTALANIEQNPILKNIPWLGSYSINFQDFFHRLKLILENNINAVKDDNIEEYLNLRDICRRDMVLLSLSHQTNCGIKTLTNLLVLPSCYQHCQKYFPKPKLPQEVWGALYTDWGAAVAACYEEDVSRATKIKPKKNPASEIEQFADTFVSYHEGCHYLENQYWRKAFKFLQKAKSEIIIQLNWCNEIDRLCELQRQQIEDFDDRLEFSNLWYLLIDSKKAKTYYVEDRSMQIGLDVDNQKINYQQAFNQLEKLQNIDPNNAVALDIITTLEINLELNKINYLWQQSNYEEAVQVAKQSHHQKVRFAVAEVCLQIVLEILQSGSLTTESLQSLEEITHWAYELCPHEPLFQTTYSQLKQLGIYR